MNNIVSVLCSLIMVAYILYRTFTTLAILPFTEPLLSSGGLYFLSLIVIALGATIFSFTSRDGIAASLAAVVSLLALISWLRVIFVAPVWTRSNLIWFVLPEACFSSAGLCKLWLRRLALKGETRS